MELDEALDKIGKLVENKAETETVNIILREKAKLVADKLATLSEEEFRTIHGGIAEVACLGIPKTIPFPLCIEHMEGLFDLCKVMAAVGYYMGKTGDKLDTV